MSAQVKKKIGSDGQAIWWFVFDSVHPKADGSRRQIKRSGFRFEREAKAALKAVLAEDARWAPRDGALTVDDVLAEFVQAKRLQGMSPNTVAQYEWARARIGDLWGGWPAVKLTSAALDEAWAQLLDNGRRQFITGKGTAQTTRPLSPRSVEAIHKTLKAAFALAQKRGHVALNPADLATPDRKSVV